MQDDSMLKKNSSLDNSVKVLKSYFNKDLDITPELSTRSMNDEIIRDDSCMEKIKSMIEKEEAMQFGTVADQFKVIDSNTVTVVIDEDLARLISIGKGNWQQLQKKAVSIRREKVQTWSLKEIAKDIYQWTLRYDPFLGYMRGVLDIEKAKFDALFI